MALIFRIWTLNGVYNKWRETSVTSEIDMTRDPFNTAYGRHRLSVPDQDASELGADRDYATS
jgi:hypothetical protein